MSRICETTMRGRLFPLAVCFLAIGVYCMSLQGCAQSIFQDREYESPSEFLLGPEDVLEIAVWKNQDLTKTVAIRPDGLISMPIVGDIQAAGLSANELAQHIAERLRPIVQNPAVSVNVKDLNSYSVYVMGEVAKPGKFQLKSYVTVLQAISMAGGFTEYAKKNKLQVVRIKSNGNHKLQESHIPIRYEELVAGKSDSGNIILLAGDTVVVP
jgi:polysaccharide export outer membrane protein